MSVSRFQCAASGGRFHAQPFSFRFRQRIVAGCLLSPGGNGPEPQRVAAPLTLDILGGLRFAPLSLAKGGAFSSRRLLIFLNRPLAQHRILAFQTCEEAVLLPPSKR